DEQADRQAHGVLARIGRRVDSVSDRYARALGGALRHARWVLPAAFVLIIAGFLVHRIVPTGFLPEIDEVAFVLDYTSPGGTAIDETDRMVHVAERTLLETPEIVGISRRTGAELGLFATEQNTGDIVARLKPERQRHRSTFEVIDEVRGKVEAQMPRLRIEFVQILSDVINDLAGAARPVEIKMFVSDLAAVEMDAERIEPAMSKVDGFEDYFSGKSEPSAEMEMTISQAEANRAGLMPSQIADAVSGTLLGASGGQVRLDDRSIAI